MSGIIGSRCLRSPLGAILRSPLGASVRFIVSGGVPPAYLDVYAMRAWGGRLYAGGWYNGGLKGIASWDGSGAWATVGDGITSGFCYALREWSGDGLLYAGGQFTAGGPDSSNFAAAWDGAAWFRKEAGLRYSSAIAHNCMVEHNGELWAAGSLAVDGPIVKRVAKWTGSSWNTSVAIPATIPPTYGANVLPSAMCVHNGSIYVSLYLPGIRTWVYRWTGSAWSEIGTNIYAYAGVSLASFGGQLYQGGSWGTWTGYNAVRRWTGSAWVYAGLVDSHVLTLAAIDGVLYAAGSLHDSAGQSCHVARLSGSQWIGLSESPALTGTRTIAGFNGAVYSGGFGGVALVAA